MVTQNLVEKILELNKNHQYFYQKMFLDTRYSTLETLVHTTNWEMIGIFLLTYAQIYGLDRIF
jgi:hypothetical protein